MKNKRKYSQPVVEVIEFSDEEVVMNLVASSINLEVEIDQEDDGDASA